jgi:adenine deaminase
MERDLLKIAVIERYTGKGGYALGFVRGFGLQEGAIGSTIAHDSHNIIVVGADDAAMATAVNALRALGGGEVVVASNEVSTLALEFAGLISLDRPEAVVRAMARLETAYHRLGGTLASPFMALSFLALPVIPALKITDQGLVAISEQGLVRQELIAETW